MIMKRICLSLLLLAVAGSLSAQAVRALEDDRYEIAVGGNTLTVDVAHGAKILSFRHGGQELLAQKPEPRPNPDGTPSRMRWINPNSYGSTFWTSPQAEWNWPPVPEYDSLPYTLESPVNESGLVVVSQPSKYGYRIRKSFTADPADGAIVITYSIINASGETRKVAPWEITRVPNGGYLEFDAKEGDVTPADLMKVSFGEGPARLDIDVADQNRKINVDGKGWLKFHDNGLVLTQRFPDIAPADAAPGEAEIQVYIDARKSFVEIEAQGPYKELQPGEALDWTVRWYLAPEEA